MKNLELTKCIGRFLEWTEANRRPKTAAHYRYHLERFATWANRRRVTASPSLPPIRADELTPALATTFANSFHAIQSLQRLCQWLYREERSLPMNPLHGLKRPKNGERRRTLTAVEMARLMRSADPIFRRFLLVLRETICRPQEARAVRWDDIADDDTADYFALLDAKGFNLRSEDAGERVIPISPRLRRLLDRLARKGVTLDAPILTDS